MTQEDGKIQTFINIIVTSTQVTKIFALFNNVLKSEVMIRS